MLMAVKNNIRYLVANIKCNMKTASEYKSNFIIQTIMMFINNGTFLIFWIIVLGMNGGKINEIGMSDIMFLWGIPTMAYGVTYFVFGGVRDINKNIISGNFDTYMLQPKHPLLGIITSRCDFSACGDFIYGLVMVVLATNFDIPKILLSILLGVLSSSIFISCEVIIRSLSVYLGDTDTIADKMTHTLLVTFTLYPEQIHGRVVKFMLYTIIPSAYLAFVPIKIVNSFDILTLILYLLVLISLFTFSIFIFNKAMKKYESGNNISLRD